jgi:hypothetical protein
MNWELINGDDQWVLRAEGQPEDLAVVWGINSGDTKWHWYVMGEKVSDAYATREEACDAATAAWVANRMGA